MAELDGKNLGAFQGLQAVSEGGHAVVYKARDSMGRTVALKILKPDVANQPGFMERFEREAKIVANLDHPNILTVFSYGKEEGHVYLAMRFIQTGALADILESEQKLGPEKILHVITHVGRALDHAHKNGVIHRDVKPENILVDKSGSCILGDFGIAKVEGNPASTSPGMVIGTYYYMSPEQCMGEELDGRSDIYALGVILYQMLVGRRPFTAPTPFSILQKHVHEEPRFPADVPVSPEVKAVVLKAMAKKKEERFQTCDELRQALKQAFSPSRVTPQPPVPVDSPCGAQARDASRRAISDEIMNAGNPTLRQRASEASTKDISPPDVPCPVPPGGPKVLPFLSACIVGMAIGGAAFFSGVPGRTPPPLPPAMPRPSSPVPVAKAVADAYVSTHGDPPPHQMGLVSILLDGSFAGPGNPDCRGVERGLKPQLESKLRPQKIDCEWSFTPAHDKPYPEDPNGWAEAVRKATGDLVLVLTRENEKTRTLEGKRRARGDLGLQVTIRLAARILRRGDKEPAATVEEELQSNGTFKTDTEAEEEGIPAAFEDSGAAWAEKTASAVIGQRDATLRDGIRYVLLVKDSLFPSHDSKLEPTSWLVDLLKNLPLALKVEMQFKKQGNRSGSLDPQLLDSRITFSFGGERSYLIAFLEEGLRRYFEACGLARAPIVEVDEKNTVTMEMK